MNLSRYYDYYSMEGFEDILVKYRIRKILEYINLEKPKKILDIGCGMDPVFQYIDYQIESYTIIEPNKRFCKIAKDISIDRSCLEVEIINDFFSETCAHKLDQDYDLIICSGVLNEVDDPVEMIKSIVKLCGSNTKVIIIVPNANSIHRILGLKMDIIESVRELTERNQKLMQGRVYDSESIIEDINTAGLKVRNFETYFIKPFTHTQMYSMMQAGIIDKKVLDGLYVLPSIDGLEGFGAEIILICSI